MLEKLPDELLLEVTSYLGFYSKLNLVQTCRKLYKVIYHRKLFEDISIPRHHIGKIMQRFKNGELDGSKVKTLSMKLQFAQENYLPQIPTIFPNLKELYTGESTFFDPEIEHADLERVKVLKDKLEVHDIRRCHKLIPLLIQDVPFTRLSFLSLDEFYFTKKGYVDINLFSCLKNLPSLEILKLGWFKVNINFMEKLHQKCPKLKTLVFKYTELEMNSDDHISPSIEPANNLLSFKMKGNIKFYDQNYLLLQYIDKKYPNLKSLDMNSLMRIPRSNTPIDEGVLTYRTYHQRLPEFMTRVMPRLLSVKIEPKLFENFIGSMRPISLHLTSIGFYSSKNKYDMFKTLKDLRFIQSLTFLTTLLIELKHTKYICHKSIILPNIKSIYLFGSNRLNGLYLELDKFLFTFNGVETLDIKSDKCKIAISDTTKYNTFKYPRLKRLELHVKDVEPKVKSYINNCLPNVNELSWKTSEKSGEYKFDFPQHTFKLFHLFVFRSSFSYNPKEIWKVQYNILTETGKKTINCLKSGPLDVRVTQDQFYLCNVEVEIICKNIWQLSDDRTVIF
ncbi:hypothetical protein K501DRAFT_25934 [Backusella circina FSU 941]|nr:hypothetical protein K501DRAFT_25934 [Backusella circina FSU 941]